jgi:hypothetical protein
LLLFLPISVLFAQEEQQPTTQNNLRLGFEFGANIGVYEPKDLYRLRESHLFRVGNVWLTTQYFGIKLETFLMNNRLGIATGLRFSQVSATFRPTHQGLFARREPFLWRVKEEGLFTEYVRLNSKTHTVNKLGIPLEIRIFPLSREMPFQHYFITGISFNYRVHSRYNIDFANDNMKVLYEDLLINQIPKSNEFSSFFYGGIGFKIGRTREDRWVPWGNFELLFPYLLLTESLAFNSNSSEFPGFGFRLLFQIPIGTNVPMGVPR